MTDRVGHVYYWSLFAELMLVVDVDDRNEDVILWKLYSLESAAGPYWLSESEITLGDHMFTRFA